MRNEGLADCDVTGVSKAQDELVQGWNLYDKEEGGMGDAKRTRGKQGKQ